MIRTRILKGFWQDVAFAVRSLLRQPLFVISTVLTLGLGIGANAAIFSAVEAVMLRPLPVRGGDRLGVVSYLTSGSASYGQPTYLNALDLKRVGAFEDVVAWDNSFVNFRSSEQSGERIFTSNVSSNYFTALSPRMALGRGISVTDGEARTPVAVLDYRLWERKFAADPAVIGKSVFLNGHPFVVIGVTEEAFHGTEAFVTYQLYVPITATPLFDPRSQDRLEQRGRGTVATYAILRPGVSFAQARAAMTEFTRQQAALHPTENAELTYVITPETRSRPDPSVSTSVAVVASVFLTLCALVLLVACANVGNLILARTTWRQGELAVRRALGASSGRIVRLLVTESVVLAGLALGVGLLLARGAIAWLESRPIAVDVPVSFGLVLDWRVICYAGLAALGAGLLAGLGAAYHASRNAVATVLREGGRGSSHGRSRTRLRSVLVTAQVAMSLMLLICAGLFTRSAQASVKADLGFRKDSLVLASVDVTTMHYTPERSRRFFERWLEQASALPGVVSASLIRHAPLGGTSHTEIHLDEEIAGVKDRQLDVSYNVTTPGIFETMAVPLTAGRDFTTRDDSTSPPVMIVNTEFAARFFTGGTAVGRRVRLSADGPPIEIVGVVGDYKLEIPWETSQPAVFVPFRQRPVDNMSLVAHVTGGADPAIAAIRRLVREADPELVPDKVWSIETHLRDGVALYFQRLGAVLAATIGLLGLAQTVVGLYGVLAYGVSQRTREIGIRLALGARRRNVVREIVMQGAKLLLIGGAIGLGLTLALSRLLSSILYGVGGFDLVSYGGAALLLAALALLSCYLPARRASRLQPTVALRAD